MKNFILGGLSVKENLVILLMSTIAGLIVFAGIKLFLIPKEVIPVDTFQVTCGQHGGCMFMDDFNKLEAFRNK